LALRKRQWELFGKYEWAREWKKAADHMAGNTLPLNYKLNQEVYPHIKARVDEFDDRMKKLFGKEIQIDNP